MTKFHEQLSKQSIGVSYTKDIDNNHLQEVIKSFLTNDTINLVERLSSTAVHEIRNSLTIIKGIIELLNKGVSTPLHYAMINSEIKKIEEIVNRISELGETQSVNFRMNNFGRMLERTIMKMNHLALFKDIKIIASLEGSLSIYCDELQLGKVFENIIKNAIEASARHKKIYITCKTNDTYVHIRIKDQGVGISEERMVHHFEPLYSIKEKVTGFSLMMSHKIINEHHGTIQINSGCKIGTIVDIHLPLLNS